MAASVDEFTKTTNDESVDDELYLRINAMTKEVESSSLPSSSSSSSLSLQTFVSSSYRTSFEISSLLRDGELLTTSRAVEDALDRLIDVQRQVVFSSLSSLSQPHCDEVDFVDEVTGNVDDWTWYQDDVSGVHWSQSGF